MTKHLAPLLLITLFIFSPNSWAEDHSKGNPHPIAEEGPKKNVERCEAWAIETFQDPKGGPKVYCESGRGKELKAGKKASEACQAHSDTVWKAEHIILKPTTQDCEGACVAKIQTLCSDTTSQACWHAELMKIHYNMISNPEENKNVPPEKDGKAFTHKRNSDMEGDGSRMEVFETKGSCEMIIAFRGTKNENDVIQDADFIPDQGTQYHAGFVKSANSYKPLIEKALADAKKICGKEVKVTLTGHSLGGAVAYAVANILKDVKNLGSPELVLFGTPRVKTILNRTADKVRAVHYFIDNDPAVVFPSKPPFKDLTDNMFKFNDMPIGAEVAIPGQELFQNHLPRHYVNKMLDFCKGENPPEAKKPTHTAVGWLKDAGDRVARSVKDAVKKQVVEGAVRAIKEVDAIGDDARTLIKNQDNSKPTPGNFFIYNDGVGFATKLACGKFAFYYSKTEAGQNYFCNGSGYNTNAETGCGNSCKGGDSAPGKACLQGCYDRMTQFCIGNWKC